MLRYECSRAVCPLLHVKWQQRNSIIAVKYNHLRPIWPEASALRDPKAYYTHTMCTWCAGRLSVSLSVCVCVCVSEGELRAIAIPQLQIGQQCWSSHRVRKLLHLADRVIGEIGQRGRRMTRQTCGHCYSIWTDKASSQGLLIREEPLFFKKKFLWWQKNAEKRLVWPRFCFFPVLIGCVLIGVMTALFADCATTVPSAVIKIGPALKHISSWVF